LKQSESNKSEWDNRFRCRSSMLILYVR
jgi:hypothetical protein